MSITDATLQAELALRIQALQAENERLSTELQIAQAAADAAQKRMRAMAQEPSDAKATQCPTCSDSFPARSYGAGFLDAVGQCENCAAGMPMVPADAGETAHAWAVVNAKGQLINTSEVRELLAPTDECDQQYPEDAPHRVEPLYLGFALQWPRTPADVRAFIGPHFSALDWGQPADGEPHEDDRYAVSAHDLLSAFRDWEEFGMAMDEQTTGEVNG